MAKHAYHHGNLKAALVTAALRAVAEKGPEGFSLRDVAARAGVTPAAPYRHFQDKDELLAAVAAECADRFAAAIVAAAEGAGDDPLERFRATGIAIVRFAASHPEHFRAMTLPGMAQRVPPEKRALAQAWQANERRMILDAQAAGKIAPIPIDELLLAASSIVDGLAYKIVRGELGDVSPDEAEELAIAVTRVIGAGFVPRVEGMPVDPRAQRAGATKRKSRGGASR